MADALARLAAQFVKKGRNRLQCQLSGIGPCWFGQTLSPLVESTVGRNNHGVGIRYAGQVWARRTEITFEGRMQFELEESNRGVHDEELLEDMRRCAKAIGRETILLTKCKQCNLGKGNAFNA